MRWLLLPIALCFALSACGYKGGLKTPSEAAEAEVKKQKRLEKKAQETQNAAPLQDK